ncbi:SCA7-domain-containing protein [Myriangium duriaei CBS 260.36]|uniref:SCA7-domain-containing protein n=1 Tax=Myriangium duriaei CBS 260.36 TaxID=1168546 RepID=A0A9P4IX62_9PEZI|nr:SCA7-domain-containing protein [Myriangium duriaei CBS 260.36]
MAPNGTSRKTPAPSAKDKSSGPNFITKSLVESGFTDSDRKTKLKLKTEHIKSTPKPTKPGNWDSDVPNLKPTSTLQASISSPQTDILLAFSTGHPLSDRADIIKCNHCKRAILRHKAKSHIESCIAKKQEKQRKKKEAKDARDAAARKAERGGVSSDSDSGDEDVVVAGGGGGAEGGLTGAKKTARKTDAHAVAGKKRKAEDVAAGPDKKKKKKDEPKAKVPKMKAPVDVERQCGVELPQGGQCARSLTCKSHSMGAKRAVPGRSAPYDKLLAEYQRKNQAKLQKAHMDSLVNPDTDLAPEGPVDSDEEKDQVLAAIARAKPRPLFAPIPVPLRRKYAAVRLREMLGNALRPGAGGTGGGGGGGMFSALGQGGFFSSAAVPGGPSGHRGSVAESVGGDQVREMSVQG